MTERDRRWDGRPLQFLPGFPDNTRDSFYWQPNPDDLEYTEYVLTLQPGPLSRAALLLPLPEPWDVRATVEYGPPGVSLFYGNVSGLGELVPIQGQAIQLRGSTVRVSAIRGANDANTTALDLSCSIVAGCVQKYYKSSGFNIAGAPGSSVVSIPALAVSWQFLWGRENVTQVTVDQLSSNASVVLTSTIIAPSSPSATSFPFPPPLGIHPLAAFLRITATSPTSGVIRWEIIG